LYALSPDPPVSLDAFHLTSIPLQLAVLARTPVGIEGAVPSPPTVVVVGFVVVGVVVVTVCVAGQLAGAEHLLAMNVPSLSFAGASHAQQ
jgi:hypothetical protein